MFHDRIGPRISLQAAAGMSLLIAMAIGVGACGAGGGAHASTIAATGATAVTTAAGPSSQAKAGSAPVVAAVSAPNPIAANTTHSVGSATPNKAATGAPGPVPQLPKATTGAPAATAPAPTTPALPARRQPTAAEVSQVISRVHALVPLFTPTPAQIAKVGDEVCTAFDQGKTVAQIKATAMQMAGAYAALIPGSVATSAVRTIVTLFCPGYTSKLA